MKLKKYKLGDEIKTQVWKTPFVVEVIYRGYVVAINKKSISWVFLFIKTYSNEVFYGSSRFLKYGLKTKEDIKMYLDEVVSNQKKMEYDNCAPVELILKEEEFEINERRDQIKTSSK